jgi:hypothetical protein
MEEKSGIILYFKLAIKHNPHQQPLDKDKKISSN